MPGISRLPGQSLTNPRADFRHSLTVSTGPLAYSTQIPQSLRQGKRRAPPAASAPLRYVFAAFTGQAEQSAAFGRIATAHPVLVTSNHSQRLGSRGGPMRATHRVQCHPGKPLSLAVWR